MKKIRIVMISMILVLAGMISVCAEGISYKDVSEGKWYTEAIFFVSEKGYMTGYSKDEFRPDGKVSRGQIAQILYAMENKPMNRVTLFSDIKQGKWYYDAVNWAGANGIMAGYSTGKFGPTDLVTRQQLATVLYKYARAKNLDLSPNGNLSAFKDAKEISEYAVIAMNWAVGKDLIHGTDKGLEPKSPVTRAQLAVILQAFSKLKPISDHIAVDGKTPIIGENGNWWIDGKDTSIKAKGTDGKDGASPTIGENGNWWIDGKDTDVKAAAEVKEAEKMEVGDKANFLPGKSFSWTDNDKNEIVFDSVDVTLYAQDKYDEVSKDRSNSFFHNVPSDTTYSVREYWYLENYYHPYIYRTEIKGHVDKKLAGQILSININNTDTNGGYYLIALIEKDGSFHCVHYEAMYGRNFNFSTAELSEVGEGDCPLLKVFDSDPATFTVYYDNSRKLSNLKNITVALKGKDIHGKDFSVSAKLDANKEKIEFKDIPASGKDGYAFTIAGVLNQTDEKLKETIMLNPRTEMEYHLWEGDLIDNRQSTVTIPLEIKIQAAYFAGDGNVGFSLRGKDINGIEREFSYYETVNASTKEIVFENVNYSDAAGYELVAYPEEIVKVTPEKKVKVNEEKTNTEKMTVQLQSYQLTVSANATNEVKEGFKIRVYGKSRDGADVDKTIATNEEGKSVFTLPCGEYNIELVDVPEGYTSWTVYDSYVWLYSDYSSPYAEIIAEEE